MNGLNPEMFRLARESRGFTQEELASISGVAQGTISKQELGLKDVGEDALNRVAQALHYPVSFFSQEERYRGLGISVIFYRKRASTLQKHIKRLQALINIYRIHAKAILRDVVVTTPNDIERIDITEFLGSPAEIAAMVRASWNLTSGPIRNLIGTIENAGGIVFRLPFGTTDIDAISQWPDDMPPLFFVNSQAPADRARYSLAHELGHMVMHENASNTMEDEANQFAAALLMPEPDIRAHLHAMTLQKAAQMKPFWRVSMASIIKRARDLECLSEQRYKHLFIHFTKLGYKATEPVTIAGEEPLLMRSMVGSYLKGGFAGDELASVMHLEPAEFQTLYVGQSGLRLAQ